MDLRYLLFIVLPVSFYANSDVKNFEGLSIELGAGYQKTDFDGGNGVEIDGVANADMYTSSENESDDFYTIGATYSHAINQKSLIGFGFDYSPTDLDIGTPTLYSQGSAKIASFELKDMFTAFLKPQFMISDNQLVYAKLGYINARLDNSDSINVRSFVSSKKSNLDGYTAGIGYRHNFENKIYGFVEANYINFNDDKGGIYYDPSDPYLMNVDAKLDAYNLKLGVGYQF